MKRIISLFAVVLAGEAIFMHPFLVPRLYRPLMIEAWGVSNVQIGLAFSAYGMTAMLSYIIGGPFADRYEPRNLIVFSLLLTVLGSTMLLIMPSPVILVSAYGFFGVSTIFFMWSALLKVTHQIGGQNARSFAMGILEGGRGLVAAIISSCLVFLVMGKSSEDGAIPDPSKTLRLIYLSVSIFMIIVSAIVWVGVRNVTTLDKDSHNWKLDNLKELAKDFNLWLLAIIVLCAYCSFKNVGNFTVYLTNVEGMSIVDSSRMTSFVFWGRPIVALTAGIIADRLTLRMKGGRFITLVVCFLLGAMSQILLACNIMTSFNLILSTILFSACFAFALRSIYFSVFGDFKIRDSVLGTAIGIVSLVGFLPDFFFGVLTGYFIDEFPGQHGFSLVFAFNGVLLVIGAMVSFICFKRVRKGF